MFYSVLNTKPEIEYSADLRFPLFAAVYQGTLPVTNATVKAVIEDGTGESFSILLKDNAIGADASLNDSNDGIYSGYILPYTSNANGRLSIKVIREGYFSKVFVPVHMSSYTGPLELPPPLLFLTKVTQDTMTIIKIKATPVDIPIRNVLRKPEDQTLGFSLSQYGSVITETVTTFEISPVLLKSSIALTITK
ncbi:unnamed protein product [Mytilus coruscus]|uniref:Uncharacterized protein n=1 Tax=Mytilus coruscus TaxID=42192 RepID=A0A6J8EA37_MYTCO|nr:unnamed protein product [Mytilus coruscus]